MARRRERRLGAHSLNRLIPNSLTLLALCAGVTAMRFAVEGLWDRAVIAVVVAAVLERLDGRIAGHCGRPAASGRSSIRCPTSSASGWPGLRGLPVEPA